MTDLEFKKEIFQLGLSEKEFSIKLSNQFAFYHLQKGFGCYEIFYKDERGGVSHKREYKSEQLGKKALIDLVRIQKGLKAKYNVINTAENFDNQKARILNLIQSFNNTDNNLYNEMFDLVHNVQFLDSKTLEVLREYVIDFGFSLDRYIFEEVFYFVESIIND